MRLCLLAALLSTATAYIALRAQPRTAINPRIAAPPRLATSDSFSPLSIFEDLPEDVEKPFSLLLFSQFVLFIGVGAVIPTIPLYGKAIGLTGASTGVVIAAPAVALLLGAQPCGKFSDAARKPAMLIGMAVIALSDLGTALSTSLIPLVISRFGLGAGRCISEAGERGMLADFGNAVPSLRGRTLAAQQATLALGIAIGAPLGGLATERWGPSAAFLCVTAAATITLGLYSLLPETVETVETKRKASSADEDRAVWLQLLADSRWRSLCAMEAGSRFGFAAKIASIPVLAAAIFGGAPESGGTSGATAAGLLLSAAGLSGLLGAPAGGWFTDQQGAKATAVVAGLTAGAALILIPIALSLPDRESAGLCFGSLVLLWSIATSAQGPALIALGQQLAPAGNEAESLALPRAAGDAVFIVAPFALGSVADSLPQAPGAECAVAGGAAALGAVALALFGGESESG